MDVEKLQKITSLAREFMKHGMSNSMDEAVSMAEKQIYGDAPVTEIRQNLEGQQQILEQEQPLTENSLQLALRKLTRVSEVQAEDIIQMQQKMNEMISVVNGLETDFKRIKQESTAQVAQQVLKDQNNKSEQKEESVQSKESSTQTVQQAQPKTGHVRSGNFNSDDVSIEKMFYFGVR